MQTPLEQDQNNFTVIRLALALLVILSHSYSLTHGNGPGWYEPLFFFAHYQTTLGGMAVDLFFIISGFLITASYERSPSIAIYLKKRIARIYPAFIAAMFLCAFLVVPFGGGYIVGNSPIQRLLNVAVHALQLRVFDYAGAFQTNPVPDVVNGAAWTIPYEFLCYLGVSLIGALTILRSKRLLLALFFVSIAGSFAVSLPGIEMHLWNRYTVFLSTYLGSPANWARLLPMYLSGIVFYRFRGHVSLNLPWILLACAGLFVAMKLPHGWSLLFPIAGAYLLFALAFHPAIKLHQAARFGDFSYGTYLYGYPVQQIVMRLLGHTVSPWALFWIASPIALACAILSWHFVEKWFLHRPSTSASLIATASPTPYPQPSL